MVLLNDGGTINKLLIHSWKNKILINMILSNDQNEKFLLKLTHFKIIIILKAQFFSQESYIDDNSN